jgi:hypothetical protein
MRESDGITIGPLFADFNRLKWRFRGKSSAFLRKNTDLPMAQEAVNLGVQNNVLYEDPRNNPGFINGSQCRRLWSE